jgi:glycosyltransferase involved in cell wall biosynthesis
MRILHILDQAGVACILAKYQQQIRGYDSKVIMTSGDDKFGIYDFYKRWISNVSLKDIESKCIEEAELADVIHIHSRIDILFKLREKFGRSKKIVLHYHGTEIRGLKKQKLPHRSDLSDFAIKSKIIFRQIRNKVLFTKRLHHKAQKLADVVIVATPDLLQLVAKGIYLPNPIDTDHFKPDAIPKDNIKQALTIDTEVTDIRWALDYCKKQGINLDIEIHDRMKNPIMYSAMPDFLKSYEIYVDIRYVNKKILENVSKTALEALACGLRVLDYKLKYRKGLPAEHDPKNIVYRLSTIYSKPF